MAEYIDRKAALMKLMQDGCSAKNLQSISDMPAADVAPVRHGRKIEDGDMGYFWLCSLCGECLPYGANYCPKCGAKMDGGEDHAVS